LLAPTVEQDVMTPMNVLTNVVVEIRHKKRLYPPLPPMQAGDPPVKGCICAGRGKCDTSGDCTCTDDPYLDAHTNCQACIVGYTWDGTKCVDHHCKNGGTFVKGTDGTSKCVCAEGFSGESCECTTKPGFPPARTVRFSSDSGCDYLLVCPFGLDTTLELDSCTYAQSKVGSRQIKKPNGGLEDCWVIPQVDTPFGHGPDCSFTVNSQTGVETVRTQQDECSFFNPSSSSINVGGASNYTRRIGNPTAGWSGQVIIGPLDTNKPECN
jgi:hypothetical protein